MILVVGEALVDIVERPDGARDEHAGGSPANVAVGLGRAGLDVTLATCLGPDAYGELIRRHLTNSRVTVLAADADRTSTAIARLDETGSATYEFDVSWDPGSIHPERTPAAVHTGSIGGVLAPGADAVESLLQQLRSTSIVTVDPNVRPSLFPDREEVAERIERLVQLADVVKASDEDVAWIHPTMGVDAVAQAWLAAGASLVVVTRGRDGSDAWARSGHVTSEPPNVRVVDTVGAGDAFMSGLLVALDRERMVDVSARQSIRDMGGETVRRLIDLANRSAAIVVGRTGAEPPWRAELD